MQVGDIAILKRECVRAGKVLHCGSGIYPAAIVASVKPFVLVSCDGSMLWQVTVDPDHFEFPCQASAEVIAIVAERMRRTEKTSLEFVAGFEAAKQQAMQAIRDNWEQHDATLLADLEQAIDDLTPEVPSNG